MEIADNNRTEATLCFVDIAGYTALTETHGDEAAADLVALFSALLDGVAAQRGEVLEVVGDGALIVCSDSIKAVELVVELFRASHGVPHFPALRAGLHRGLVLPRGGRLFGTPLNLAARVAAQARGGQVLATREVADAASAHGLPVRSLGPYALRNLTEPVELFELDVEGAGPESAVDPVCRMRVKRDDAARVASFERREFWFCSAECADRFAASPDSYVPKSERATGAERAAESGSGG